MIKLNGIEIEPTIFPDKTSQVWKINPNLFLENNEIVWDFESEAEFMHLVQLCTLLKVTIDWRKGYQTLTMPYLPYARQDKDIDNDSCFALSSFAVMINALEFDSVFVTDAHSHIAGNLISNLVDRLPIAKILEAIEDFNPDVILFPDRGAADRYDIKDLPTVACTKERDQSTGKIRYVKAPTSFDCVGKNVLMVDDLCDGGGTFIGIAKQLKEYACGYVDIGLYVSHGLFTKGTQVLRDAGISKIYTKEGEVK